MNLSELIKAYTLHAHSGRVGSVHIEGRKLKHLNTTLAYRATDGYIYIMKHRFNVLMGAVQKELLTFDSVKCVSGVRFQDIIKNDTKWLQKSRKEYL